MLIFLETDRLIAALTLARAVMGLAVGMSTGAAVAWMPELDRTQTKRSAALAFVSADVFGHTKGRGQTVDFVATNFLKVAGSRVTDN